MRKIIEQTMKDEKIKKLILYMPKSKKGIIIFFRENIERLRNLRA